MWKYPTVKELFKNGGFSEFSLKHGDGRDDDALDHFFA